MRRRRSIAVLRRGAVIGAWAGCALVAWAVVRLTNMSVIGDADLSLMSSVLILLAGVVLIIGFIACWAWFDRAPPLPPESLDHVESAELEPVPSGEIDVVSTMLLLLNGTSYRTRIIERVEVADGYFKHDVSVEYVLPERDDPARAGPSTYLIPVLRIARGALIDNLVMTTEDGRQLSTLNNREFAGVAEFVIRKGVAVIGGTGELSESVRDAIDKLVGQTRADNPLMGTVAATAASADDEAAKAFGELTKPNSWHGSDQEWTRLRNRLIRFCAALGDGHAILAPISGEPGDRAVVRYSYTRAHEPPTRMLRDTVRFFFGLRPHRHGVAIAEHRRAQSYHLEFRAPPEQYIFDCDVVALPDPNVRAQVQSNIVVAPRAGTGARDYAHIYVRQASESAVRRSQLLATLDCREKPPGLLGAVTLVAVSQFVLIWFVGAFHSYYFPADVPADDVVSAVSTDVPALLLALPGLAAGWLGAQFTGERLRSTSLATVIGTLLAGLLAIVSTAGAVAKAAGGISDGWFSIAHPAWLGVMLASLILVSDLTLRLIVRSVRFARRINHPSVVERRLL